MGLHDTVLQWSEQSAQFLHPESQHTRYPCRTFIEIGVSDSNPGVTRHLQEDGWTGILLGSIATNPPGNLTPVQATGDNVVPLLQQATAATTPDVLAVHADAHTFWVLQAALQGGYRPRIITTQINHNFHPADTFVAPHTPETPWNGSTVFGAAAGAFDMLFEQFGYSTVAINQAQDSIFAVNKAAVGQERLFSMAELVAGLTEAPLCQAAYSCTGDSTWLQLTAELAPRLGQPRAGWYDALPAWSIRCMPVERSWGSNQAQLGVVGGPEALPAFLPGVVVLLPCLPIPQVMAVANQMIAAQTGQQRIGVAEQVDAALNSTVWLWAPPFNIIPAGRTPVPPFCSSSCYKAHNAAPLTCQL